MPSIRELLTRRRTKSLTTPDHDRGVSEDLSPIPPVSPTSQNPSGPRVQQRIHPNLNALAEELAPSIQESPISERKPSASKRTSAPSLDPGETPSFVSLTPWIRSRRHSTGGTTHTSPASPTHLTFSATNNEANEDAQPEEHPSTTLEDLPESPPLDPSLTESPSERPVIDRSASSSPQTTATPAIRANRLLNRLVGITHRPSFTTNTSSTNRDRQDPNPPSAWNTFGQKGKRAKTKDSVPHMSDFGFGRGEPSYASSQRSSVYGDSSSRVGSDPTEVDRPQSQQSRSEWYFGHSRAPSQNDSTEFSRSHSRNHSQSYPNSFSRSHSQSRSPSQVFVTPVSTPGGTVPSPPSSGFTFGSGTLGRKQKGSFAPTPPPPMPKLRLSLFGRSDSTRSQAKVGVDTEFSSDGKAEIISDMSGEAADPGSNFEHLVHSMNHSMPRPSTPMPSTPTSAAQPTSVPSMPSLSPRLKAQDIFTNISQSSEGKQENDSDVATMVLPGPSLSGVSSPVTRTRISRENSAESGMEESNWKRLLGDQTAAGYVASADNSNVTGANDSEVFSTTRDIELMMQQPTGAKIPFILAPLSAPEFASLSDVPGSSSADAPVASIDITNANVKRLVDSPDFTSEAATALSSPPSRTLSAPSKREKDLGPEAMSTPQIDKGKGKADATSSSSRLSPPSNSSHPTHPGIYSIPRVPSPLAQGHESRRTRLTSAPASATSPLVEELRRSRMRPATASSASAGWKRKAEDGEDGSVSGHRKRATFAEETFTRPRQPSGASYVAGRKRARLSETPEGDLTAVQKESLSRNSTQRSRKISQSTSTHIPRRNISSSHSYTSHSQYSQFSQNVSSYDSSGPSDSKQMPTTANSKAPSIASSIPVSALITPRAPSVSASQHVSTIGGYHYHMRDPRKPPKVQPTSWRLSLPEADGLKSPTRRLYEMLIGSWKRKSIGVDIEKGREADIETAMSRDVTSSSSGHRGWIEAGGSPIHAWLFFIGFIVFPLWWIGAFMVGIPRTRKLGEGGHEKGVVLDDPQVEHDALSWRTRCRVMALVSLLTYVPFIVLVAIFVPRN